MLFGILEVNKLLQRQNSILVRVGRIEHLLVLLDHLLLILVAVIVDGLLFEVLILHGIGVQQILLPRYFLVSILIYFLESVGGFLLGQFSKRLLFNLVRS